MEVPCVNCKKEFPSGDGKFWEKIFVCPDCYTVVTRIQERGEARLKYLLSILRQALKDALLEGRLQFATAEEANKDEGEAKNDFLDQLQELARRTRTPAHRDGG